MPTTIVLATANPHKVAELRRIFAGVPLLEIRGLGDLPGGPARYWEPEETGCTFESNARIKAVAYAEQTGHLCLADDSGLEIDALGGRPGVISSHYSTDGRETGAGRGERDAANNARVLRELADVPQEGRGARFVCCMCLARPGGGGAVLHETRGTFSGRIGVPPAVPKGDHGFGYDPIFLVAPGFTRTGAELSADEKNLSSHRAAAAALMLRALHALTLGGG